MPKPASKSKAKPIPHTTAAAAVATHWLAKSEPSSYSIDDLQRDGSTDWTGVRNFAARNFMRDRMKPGHPVLYYHSGDEPGIYGLAKINSAPKPDPTAFDKKDSHFDPKSSKDNPTWMMVELKFVEKFKQPITLEQLKAERKLAGMLVLQRGQRLSIMPVSDDHFQLVRTMAKG